MDPVVFAMLFSFIYACIFLLKSGAIRRKSSIQRPPPGPPRWLFIGNLADIIPGSSSSPYRTLATLAETYGPVMSLKLGKVNMVVASTVEAAKVVLKEKDQVFSYRSVPHGVTANDHHKYSVVWLPPEDKWRIIRKICSVHMFGSPRLNTTQELRLRKIEQLRDYLKNKSRDGDGVVDVGGVIFTTVLNIITNTLFSVDFAYYGTTATHEYECIVKSAMEGVSKTNIADFFPLFRWIDPFGIHKKSRTNGREVLEILDVIIQDRIKLRASAPSLIQRDVLDALLDLNSEDYDLSLNDIKHLFMDLLLAGTDTTTTTLEWTMAELLRNPEMMERARVETKEAMEDGEGVIRESEIHNLPYLQALLKETFRLYPAGPLLLPREAAADTELMGYAVAKRSRVAVNVWAVGRDSSVWGSDAEQFRPERFLEGTVDYKGRDFELLPFGSGRRICPGLPLAHRALHIILATLVQFKWVLVDGDKSNALDMSEKPGVITVRKATPLLAMPSEG